MHMNLTFIGRPLARLPRNSYSTDARLVTSSEAIDAHVHRFYDRELRRVSAYDVAPGRSCRMISR